MLSVPGPGKITLVRRVGHGCRRFPRRCLVVPYVVCGVACRLWFAVAGGVCPLVWAGAG